MKYLMWLLWLFIPRQDGEGDGDGDGGTGDDGDGGAGDSDSGGSGDSAAGDPAKPIGGSDPEGRPDWLPEKFWNEDLKAPRAEVMAKSFTELENKLRSKTDDLKAEILEEMRASAPEEYEVNLSDELKIPDNVELDLTKEDPLVSWFFGFAKENGFSQEMVDKALNEYVKIEMENMTDVQAEIEKLGDHGQDRLLRVHNWLESRLTEDQFAAINPLLSSAAQVEALESLMKTSGPANFDGDGAGKPLTLEELREMQNDPRYHRDKDPAFIKKVEEGYRRLYKGQ
jgi:hypothetical protein